MDIGNSLQAVLVGFLAIAFGVAGYRGLKGDSVSIPTENTLYVDPGSDDVPKQYRRPAGALFLLLALLSLLGSVALLRKL